LVSLKFIKSSIIYTLSGALPIASAIILLPLYLNYLTLEQYGVFSICLAFSVLIQVIVSYSFDAAIYVHYHEFKADVKKLSSYISSSFIFIIGLGIASLLFFGLVGPLVFTFLPINSSLSFYPYGILSVGIGVFQAIFKVHNNLLQVQEKPGTFLRSNVISFIVICVVTYVGLNIFPNSLLGPLGGRLLASAISGVWSLFRVFRDFGFSFTTPWHLVSYKFNAYTFIYQLQQWLINYVDRFVILLFLPLSTVGLYDFAIKCLIPIELILNGLHASINPKVIKIIANQPSNDKGSSVEINRYYYGLISIVMLLICAAILVTPIFFDFFLANSGYNDVETFLPYIALLYIFRCIRLYFIVPISALKLMKRLTGVNLLITLIKVGAMVLSIPAWGLYGVAFSAALSYAIELIFLWMLLMKNYLIHINTNKLLVVPFTILSIILTAELLLPPRYEIVKHIFYFATCFTLIFTAYKNEVSLIPKLLKQKNN
jgi:O-antigen/teichoic acid export membrane protein